MDKEIANVNLSDLKNEEVVVETEDVEPVEEPDEEPDGEPEAEPDGEPDDAPEDAPEAEQPKEEELLDFRKWAEQTGELPDGIKSEEDLLEAYRAALPEMKRGQSDVQRLREVDQALREQGYANGVTDVLGNQRPAEVTKSTDEPYFQENAARSLVETMVKDGKLEGDNASNYKSIAALMDNTYGPMFKRAEKMYTSLGKGMVNNQKMIRDLLWRGQPDAVQAGVDRKAVESLLDRGLFATPEEAIRYLAYDKPDVISDLTKKAEERGKEKGRKKLRRSYAIRRTKTPQKQRETYDYSKYQQADGQWDLDKITKGLGVDKGHKMIETWEAENK